MNEEFDTKRQTVRHSRPMYSLCALLTLQAGRQVIHWLLVENILLICVFTIEILDSKSNGKLNRYTVDYYV